MPGNIQPPPLAWLEPGEPFPPVSRAWGNDSPAPGLLAAGSQLDADQLTQAYRQGIFPWYSPGQPVLWWSPNPRMVLQPKAFRLHRSLRQSLRRWLGQPGVALTFDRAFHQVMTCCAEQPRPGQSGSWIVPDIVQAYTELHHRGLAHSAELWRDGQLLAGLYFVALGQAVYGESMFTRVRDGSKMALCLLVSVARHHGIGMIDCQQNTRHLASLGASEIPRAQFMAHMQQAQTRSSVDWASETLYWDPLVSDSP
jgi:leucyl/phenylalanyl-tRNA---protein transferase